MTDTGKAEKGHGKKIVVDDRNTKRAHQIAVASGSALRLGFTAIYPEVHHWALH